MSGTLHFLNQTPIQWFLKKQNTVETITYSTEFMVARQACKQLINQCYTLLVMGIPLDPPSWLFSENQSDIMSSTIPSSTLNKRHNALSYQRLRESIAARIIYFIYIEDLYNPSDFLTKFLPYHRFRPLIQPLLFWYGDTLKDDLSLPIPVLIQNDTEALRGVSDFTLLEQNPPSNTCGNLPGKMQV
jgi:hypothetical protein